MFLIRLLRISLPVLLACNFAISAQTSAAKAPATTAEMEETRNYRLSMDKVDKFAAASQNLMALVKTHPEMRSSMSSAQFGAKTIDESVARVDSKFPEAAAAIRKSGMSVRDYLLTSLSLLTTTMAVGMKKEGQLKQIPASISPENLAFVEQNYPKIEKVLKSLSAASSQ